MTPDRFFQLPSQDQIGWAKAFGDRFGSLIQNAAKANCIPASLLAAIVANEMVDWRWPDGTFLDGITGGGVGPAQIAPATAVNAGATGLQTSDFRPRRQTTPAGPTSVDTSYVLSPEAQHQSAARDLLQTDNGAIDIAARLLKNYLNEMCNKSAAGGPIFGLGANIRFNLLDDRTVRDFCNKCKDCKAIVGAPLPPGFVDAYAAKWNTPDVWNANHPIGDKNYPNADRNGAWADQLTPLIPFLIGN
jgi:hypothetical protein